MITAACAASFDHAHDVVHGHVEHAVGFVKHEVFHVPEIDVTLLEVEQSTWCGRGCRHRVEGHDLRTLPNTAEDDLVAQTERTAVTRCGRRMANLRVGERMRARMGRHPLMRSAEGDGGWAR